ncbi:putative mitochondrial RNA editing comple protein MP63 [Leptomonas pyrrhocoris]|uniref:Putative mitochondrial RNA editing comple protein MP63 n=1 Tax=Leptomonas pyrrhocoris TaxID=157538 RepID=A0A0M9G476_LEPPY|nr:putative mitochondrial RNA editing comple protein MP63 [Leptomonas pyrrhocoris]KPA81907.1 putative mitochondrial RNA editing comple protein MP63 [Leptomonas pyrrhocoris]|eukprot:XP_015660346.1 putative mitochondrial RNA editing comple protein MP63 [Leptomonas pyrrhocoris]
MQRCIRIVGVAACRCAFRRLRQVGAARHTFVDGQGFVLGAAASFPLATSSRRQATAPDKRFHCSVCKKAFRLEMAAKLHLQQVHSGEGAVEAGAGPGQPEEQTTQTPVGVFRNTPPQAPTVVTPVQPDLYERPARREKPAPKPLHQAEREVPSLVMEKMLSMWDDIGVKRMGNQFVHSSMVMRVFAARPSDYAEPLYGVVNPEGENPFESGGSAVDSSAYPAEADERNIFSLSMSDAFVMATAVSFGPCHPAKCPNPFRMKFTREASKVAPKAEVADQQTAPVTPFGQLPLFGQLRSPMPPQETAEPVAVAPESSATLVSSPFKSSIDNSPFSGAATTPFSDVGYSPFASAEETPAPAAPMPEDAAATAAAAPAAIPSPFLSAANAPSSPFAAAASPFAASPFPAPDAQVPGGGLAGADARFVSTADAYSSTMPAAAATEVPSVHVCSVCEKRFSTHEGLRMHSKAKHSLDLPKEKDQRRRKSVPDLPAYIPSPVDLSMTSPFGSSTQTTAWSEVELTPCAQSMSNITVAGRIVDSDALQDGSVLLTVFVREFVTGGGEMITVRCSAEAMKAVSSSFRRGEYVFACGSLRLLPVVDETTKKMFASPVVYVTSPTGVVAKLNSS